MGRLYSIASGAVLGLSAVALIACDGTSVIGGGGGAGGSGTSSANSSSGSGGGPTAVTKADKVDIVLGIDNSRSMADKQEILSLALSDLISSLANPACIDVNHVPAAQQPQSPLDPCPAGTAREFPPVLDIHVGIVTTSLGGHGSDSCSTDDTQACGAPNPSNNDAGHLISRTAACSNTNVPTYQNKGFLSWDPAQKQVPPGEMDVNALTGNLKDMVIGAGQVGCGYESQLESWYRFLVDPEPYQSISVIGDQAVPTGVDNALLQQRAEFLRPDSLLAILMLSDEDDCSIKEFGQFFYAGQQRLPNDPKKTFHLPRARQECATNPNDPCCKSCGSPLGNCPVDPMCISSPTLSDVEDDINLRCWDNKRRFGIDFLYPVDRYIQGLTSAMVPDRSGNLVPNPIYSDLNPNDNLTAVRDPGLVVLAGIVGVPWQDIARDPTDLTKGYKNSAELSQTQNGMTGWDVILGDPGNYVPPKDPLMVESVNPRMGTNPVTGAMTAPPGSPPNQNPINGHEYTISHADDLQYACVFPLATPRDCSDFTNVSCDCTDPANDNPLCDPQNPTMQVRAKAYPGTRQLNVLKGLGAQGVVASICPSEQSDTAKADYAYRPAIRSLVERVKDRIGPSPIQ